MNFCQEYPKMIMCLLSAALEKAYDVGLPQCWWVNLDHLGKAISPQYFVGRYFENINSL